MTINFCQMSQDVGKLMCQIAQVPLYMCCLQIINTISTQNVEI